MKDYHINCFYNEDDGYIADIPDLDSCSAFGRTPQEAVAEVLKAKEAWLAAARAEGRTIPPPTHRPALYATRWSPGST
jgi:predicted RNase H-like HicB family nuclease